MQGAQGRKKRGRPSSTTKAKKDAGADKLGQPSLVAFTQHANGQELDTAEGAVPFPRKEQEPSRISTLEDDANHGRRKKRRTVSPAAGTDRDAPIEPQQHAESVARYQQLETKAKRGGTEKGDIVLSALAEEAHMQGEPTSGQDRFGGEAESIALSAFENPDAGDPRDVQSIGDQVTKTAAKKKVIRISRNGKLLSSPPPVKPESDTSATPKKRRGRPKGSKPKPFPTVTVIKYGSDTRSRQSIGKSIDDILAGNRVSLARPVIPAKILSKHTGPPKPTHPFFLGQAAKDDEAPPAKSVSDDHPPQRTPRKSAVTPGKLKSESRNHQPDRPIPAFGPIAGDNRSVKHAGTYEAPWPSKGMAHVRNVEDNEDGVVISNAHFRSPILKSRKLKNSATTISLKEDVIARLSHQLRPIDTSEPDHDFAQPENVRLPSRLLTTGIDIQERLRRELFVPTSHFAEQEGHHPAITLLFKDIEQTLTPFDKGECETQSWVQKYAPTCASHVLQPGKEALYLRDWLQNLTVMAVQSSKDGKDGTTNSETKRPPKKRRKKVEDDFIVPSDEEEEGELVEFSDSEGCIRGLSRSARQLSLKRPRLSRHKNVVILSGPHGCGKSTTVYAVARELGFEVFEINSGSRRSGKDIQEKVGDMIENHLVSHARSEARDKHELVPIEDPDHARMSQALQKDLDSGRQGTMTSFFTSKLQTTAKAKPETKLKGPPKATSIAQATLPIAQKQRKAQKQSLILFEEADVLFEEDQHFWAQVTKLAFQSKRPIIITCNNENAIPINDLPLAAILRLNPPPIDLATDYLLTLAAKEGHILQRKVISDLYKSNNEDLRASIMHLDFWCQMSVGDRKGGLDWIYQRWPPGKDVDQNGRVLRVASEETYQSGMGMLSHDMFESTNHIGFDKDEEILKETWTEWGIAPDTWTPFQEGESTQVSDPAGARSHLEDLKHLDHVLSFSSASDVYCRVGLPSYAHHYNAPTDPSLPSIPDKQQLSYTINAPLLQVDHMSDFTNFDTNMCIQSHLSLQRAVGGSGSLGLPGTVVYDGKRESASTDAILDHKAKSEQHRSLSRPDFSTAFDILAYPPASTLTLGTSYQLTPSVFDRTFSIVVEELAPFVRSIVSHEIRLEDERMRLSSLLSEGGRSKRPRMTRASRVALEGGTRESKRRERWFHNDLNRTMIMATAGRDWSGIGYFGEEMEMASMTEGSLPGTQEC